jgi:hypothetical protein
MMFLLYIILLAIANGSGGADADAVGGGGVAPQEGDHYSGGYFCSQGFTNADVFVGSQLPNTHHVGGVAHYLSIRRSITLKLHWLVQRHGGLHPFVVAVVVCDGGRCMD